MRKNYQDWILLVSYELYIEVIGAVEFGRSRGDAAADSDLDLVALVDEKTPELEQALDEVAYNLMWDHDFKPIISLKVCAEERFRNAVAKGLCFYRNVEREGVTV